MASEAYTEPVAQPRRSPTDGRQDRNQGQAAAVFEWGLEVLGSGLHHLARNLSHSYNEAMKIATAQVVNGQIEIPEDFLTEGDSVMLLAPGTDEAVRLTADQERELLEAVEEIRRGESIGGEELLAELRALSAR